MAGLALWSFLMATAHGAGLMLVPVAHAALPCRGPAAELTAAGSLSISLGAIGVHTAAMLIVTAAIAVPFMNGLGLSLLRRGWINLDLLWIVALVTAGLILLASDGARG